MEDSVQLHVAVALWLGESPQSKVNVRLGLPSAGNQSLIHHTAYCVVTVLTEIYFCYMEDTMLLWRHSILVLPLMKIQVFRDVTPYRMVFFFGGATAWGGPWPPLQYASKPLHPLLCLSIRSIPSFSGP